MENGSPCITPARFAQKDASPTHREVDTCSRASCARLAASSPRQATAVQTQRRRAKLPTQISVSTCHQAAWTGHEIVCLHGHFHIAGLGQRCCTSAQTKQPIEWHSFAPGPSQTRSCSVRKRCAHPIRARRVRQASNSTCRNAATALACLVKRAPLDTSPTPPIQRNVPRATRALTAQALF